MSSVPAGIWIMWAVNFGLATVSLLVAIKLNKREEGALKWF